MRFHTFLEKKSYSYQFFKEYLSVCVSNYFFSKEVFGNKKFIFMVLNKLFVRRKKIVNPLKKIVGA